MSDLGAIFHVKKNGVQYDAHAYTTIDECPSPNIKINFHGTNAFVKLENNGSGDVPCYVRTPDGAAYQVRKEAIPTGEVSLEGLNKIIYFTVPYGVNVIKAIARHEGSVHYIGVTPNQTHRIAISRYHNSYELECTTHNDKRWQISGYSEFTLLWSPEINKHTPDITDY